MDKQEFKDRLMSMCEEEENLLYGYGCYLTDDLADNVYEVMKNADSSLTAVEVADLYEEEHYDPGHMGKRAVHEFWKHYVSVDAVAERPDNELHSDDRFKSLLAEAVAKKGTAEDVLVSAYGWKDYDFTRNNKHGSVVAVLNVKEDMWSEFEGTFVDNSRHEGVTGVVAYSDGTARRFRLELSVGELMRTLSLLDDLSK